MKYFLVISLTLGLSLSINCSAQVNDNCKYLKDSLNFNSDLSKSGVHFENVDSTFVLINRLMKDACILKSKYLFGYVESEWNLIVFLHGDLYSSYNFNDLLMAMSNRDSLSLYDIIELYFTLDISFRDEELISIKKNKVQLDNNDVSANKKDKIDYSYGVVLKTPDGLLDLLVSFHKNNLLYVITDNTNLNNKIYRDRFSSIKQLNQ